MCFAIIRRFVFINVLFPIQLLFGQSVVYPNNDVLKNVYSHTHINSKPSSKKPLDFDAIDKWPAVGDNKCVAVSSIGDYFSYAVTIGVSTRADSLVVQSTRNTWRKAIANKNAKPGFFSADSKKYIYQLKDLLQFALLGSSEIEEIKDVASYKTNSLKDVEWIAIGLKNPSRKVLLKNLVSGQTTAFDSAIAYEFDLTAKWFAVTKENEGRKNLVIRELATGKEHVIIGFNEFNWSSSGQSIVYVQEKVVNSSKVITLHQRVVSDNSDVVVMELPFESKLISYVQSASGDRIAVLEEDKSGVKRLWHWRSGMNKAEKQLDDRSLRDELKFGTPISLFGFNSIGLQLTKPALPEPKIEKGGVSVDVWHYLDTVIQQKQASELKKPIEFAAVFYVETHHLEYLETATEKLSRLTLEQSKGEYALVRKRGMDIYSDQFWKNEYDSATYWIVRLSTGERRQLSVKSDIRYFAWFSPGGNYLLYYDHVKMNGDYYSVDVRTGKVVNISSIVPKGLLGGYETTKREPEELIGPAGMGGWLENEHALIVYDKYDIWELDVTGGRPAINLTNGYGRKNNIRFVLLNTDRNNYQLNALDPLISQGKWLLSAFNTRTKAAGFYSIKPDQIGDPILLNMGPYFFQRWNGLAALNEGMEPIKATNNDTWIVQRQSATDAPNYYATIDYKEYRKLSNYTPHANYNWLTTELHQFKGTDGYPTAGVLYKPENFDSKHKYPVIISFYWNNLTVNLNQYSSAKYLSTPGIWVEPAWLVSHGYLVFTPDMTFINHKWGPSSLSVIDGAADYLSKLPYVDGKHIGASGHSNSGITGYYIFTHSKKFAAMSMGGAGTNWIASTFIMQADGSIFLKNHESGLSMVGLGELWKNKDNWIDHTPVLQADNALCPLLIFHNRSDGAYEMDGGVAMFLSLRRLEKPCWWLQYDNRAHVVRENDAKDFTIRYTQYFDHFLKGAPAPRWMTRGISYKDKGKEFGYELDPDGKCGPTCPVCNKKVQFNNSTKNK